MEIGLHIADFTWNGGARALGPDLARHVQDAEAAGITRITVMDHFWQLGESHGLGPYENDMLEAYTTLGFIAAHTKKVLLHTLVTGVIYREPAVLAKQISTLDVLSGGRAGLGIGAAWNEDESRGLGLPFPPLKERFERLEETLQICDQMWSESEQRYDGDHYHLDRTLNVPRGLREPRPYIMVGGGGEKKTLRLVAQYADACNIFATPESARKLDVLRRHCDDVGRDFDTVEKTTSWLVTPTTTKDDIVRTAHEMRDLGFTVTYLFSGGITDPSAVIDLYAAVLPEIQ
jgi:F420-dependent oxidoreductase-like protein